MINITVFDIWIGFLVATTLVYGFHLGRKNKVFNASTALMFIWLVYAQLINEDIIYNRYYLYFFPVLIFSIPWFYIGMIRFIKKKGGGDKHE